mgnify:CR=1 FL=1
MLLRHTSKKIKERQALTINPAKTCQPIGAMYAALGIHHCLPHSHGSQGCCAYHRSSLTRHYKEPVMAGTSSFTEGASVFGGQANLLQAINNMFMIYDPKVIAVHTTCLSETIGDDIHQIINKAESSGKIPEDKYVIYANTPSYQGSHITGFANMVAGMVNGFSKSKRRTNSKINVIPGWIEPSDMREIKCILKNMKVSFIMFPDTSDVLDAPQTGKHVFYPKGGVTVEELKQTGSAIYTIALGKMCSEPGALALESKCSVPFKLTDIPIGIGATDRFLMCVSGITGREITDDLTDERGRLVDIITDMHQYLDGKKVALFGDPDILIPLVEFLSDMDMKPVHIISGTQGRYFTERTTQILEKNGIKNVNIQNGNVSDMFLLHQWIKNEPVDLIIGNTYGKYIARDEDIPFVRLGFPIYDRIGHSYFPSVGYTGGMRILEKILGVIMDRLDRDTPEEGFELVM